MKYNFGCGDNKLAGCTNIDINEDFKPDLALDFLKFPYPLDSDSAELIYFLHTIEHIEKPKHPLILSEFHRILKSDGRLIIAYPEFERVAKNWIDNKNGFRASFWEATIYGRQSTKFDYHVCAMDSIEFKQLLQEIGFDIIEIKPEVGQEFNTIVIVQKGTPGVSRERGVLEEIWGRKLVLRHAKDDNDTKKAA